jgi:pimeloyl-ACP methyl ester carboxylesterase
MPRAQGNGISVRYRVQGQGEPLVLIMGYSGDLRGWFFQTGAFQKRYRVVTFDNRGVGGTDKPDGPYSMRMMADDAVGLMEHLGIDKAHILGVSMGGMIAQEVAISYPERVNRLVLGCTAAGRSESSGIASVFPKALGLADDYTDDDVRALPIKKVAAVLYSYAFQRCLYRAVFIPLSRLQLRQASATGLTGQLEAVLAQDTFDRLPTIGAPTMVITGTDDMLIKPSSSDDLAAAIPNARLEKIDGGSHAFFMERRGEFNREVLGFLGGS